ncbi:hypothetical protein niasHS_010566 [Heterodera schachtii]|uniref:BZIP domain-containing protein n=1 Tax=Heterodera schachtii TaxID=97005 RepID=A0ABD2IRY4_HETSC
MDILAGIEAAKANTNLKQYMATVNQLANATGLSPRDLAASNTLGSAFQALTNNSIGIGPLLSAGQSVPNIGSLNPLLVAAAAALSEQHAKSMFSSAPPLALSLPQMANFNVLPSIFHSQFGQGEGTAEQHTDGQKQKEDQNVPTLVSLLASASVGTPQRQIANLVKKKTPTQTPPAKRSRLSQKAAKKEGFLEHSNAFFGTSTNSEFPNASVDSPSGTEVPLTASLLSALTATSGKFPLAAASPPALPSPPYAQNSMASSVASHQPPKSALSSPISNNTLVRRLSSLSASSSSTNGTGTTIGGTGTAHNAMPIVLPRTPQRKPAAPIPAEKKDGAYYERRRKNNDAAKRSRDTRRQKEEQTAQRAAYLEQENIQLRKRVDMLNAELARHRAILFSLAAPTANASLLTNTPPPQASAEERRHSHVLASPTSTTTANGECHPRPGTEDTVETERNGLRMLKREGGTPFEDDDEKGQGESDGAEGGKSP